MQMDLMVQALLNTCKNKASIAVMLALFVTLSGCQTVQTFDNPIPVTAD